MKKNLFLLTGIILLSGCLSLPDEQSHSKRKYPDVKVSRLIRVYDGDTFICDIDELSPIAGKNIHIRLKGVDTPELNDPNPEIRKSANEEKERLERLLTNAKGIELRDLGRDKYFRILASVYIDGEDVLSKLNSKYWR